MGCEDKITIKSYMTTCTDDAYCTTQTTDLMQVLTRSGKTECMTYVRAAMQDDSKDGQFCDCIKALSEDDKTSLTETKYDCKYDVEMPTFKETVEMCPQMCTVAEIAVVDT